MSYRPRCCPGLLRLPGGDESPPTTAGDTAWPVCFFGSRSALSGGPAACLLLMDFNTAWLLHAGDHGLVKVAPAPLRRCISRHDWPRSLTCCCSRLASSLSGGVAGPGSAGSVVPPSLGDRRAPGFFGDQAIFDALDSRQAWACASLHPLSFGREGGRSPCSWLKALPPPFGLLLRERPSG